MSDTQHTTVTFRMKFGRFCPVTVLTGNHRNDIINYDFCGGAAFTTLAVNLNYEKMMTTRKFGSEFINLFNLDLPMLV